MLAVGGQGTQSVTAQVDDYSASHSTVSVTAYSLALGKGFPKATALLQKASPVKLLQFGLLF